jgi:Zn-dependent protease with chaperone function/tetratricopeptide (TPR) repeat protein
MSVQTFRWQSQLSMAKNALVSGDYMTAETCLNAAMNLSHAEDAPEDGVAEIFYNRGICFECRDKLSDARQSFNQALHTYVRCFGPTSPQAVKAAKAKALVEIKLGRVEDAQEQLSRLLEQLIQQSGEDDTEVRETQMQMRRLFGRGNAPSPVPALIPSPSGDFFNQAGPGSALAASSGLSSTSQAASSRSSHSNSSHSPTVHAPSSPEALAQPDENVAGCGQEESAEKTSAANQSSPNNGDSVFAPAWETADEGDNQQDNDEKLSRNKPSEQTAQAALTQERQEHSELVAEPEPASAPASAGLTDDGPHTTAWAGAAPFSHSVKFELADQKPDPNMINQFQQRLSESATGQRPDGPARAGARPHRQPQTKALIPARATDFPFDIEALVHPRDRFYTACSRVIAVWAYGLSLLCLVGFVIAPIVLVAQYVVCGLHLGHIRGRGIKVSPDQFPEVFESLENLSAVLGMPSAPDTYVIQEHGLLNAFAKRLHQKDMILISSDVLEMAYGFGEAELAFVLSHELAHVKRGHVKWAWVDIPADIVPFLGNALSRAREYTCDRIAQALVPEGAVMGLVALAAGTKIYRRVNLKALYEQQDREWNFWTWFSEIHSTHPNLLNRIRALGLRHEQIKRIKEFESNAKK